MYGQLIMHDLVKLLTCSVIITAEKSDFGGPFWSISKTITNL